MRELGNPKGKKPKEVPQHYEVCEPCKANLDAGEEIPLHLLSKLLKYKFLSIKANDLKRRDTEKKVILADLRKGPFSHSSNYYIHVIDISKTSENDKISHDFIFPQKMFL